MEDLYVAKKILDEGHDIVLSHNGLVLKIDELSNDKLLDLSNANIDFDGFSFATKYISNIVAHICAFKHIKYVYGEYIKDSASIILKNNDIIFINGNVKEIENTVDKAFLAFDDSVSSCSTIDAISKFKGYINK